MRRRLALLLAAVALLFTPWMARAELVTGPEAIQFGELGGQVRQLHEAWGRMGQVTHLPVRLAHRGEEFAVPLVDHQVSRHTTGCTTIAAIAAQNVAFLLVFDEEFVAPSQRSWPIPSAAGLAQVTRCGERKEVLSGLRVQLRSQRGLFELIVLESEHPPPGAAGLLRGRNPGPSQSAPKVGPRPTLAPVLDRVSEWTRRAERSGAVVDKSSLVAPDSGRTETIIHLTAGCYRFGILAPSDALSPPDLDARLLELTTGKVLVLDDEHAGQASLDYCAGSSQRVRLEISGALPHTSLSLLQGRWPLPEAIPPAWGSTARQRLAQELFQVGALGLVAAPVDVAVGVRGATSWMVRLVPGACYVVAVGSLRGMLHRITVEARGARVTTRAVGIPGSSSATVHFCADSAAPVELSVEALGSSLAWIAAVWPLQGWPE